MIGGTNPRAFWISTSNTPRTMRGTCSSKASLYPAIMNAFATAIQSARMRSQHHYYHVQCRTIRIALQAVARITARRSCSTSSAGSSTPNTTRHSRRSRIVHVTNRATRSRRSQQGRCHRTSIGHTASAAGPGVSDTTIPAYRIGTDAEESELR